MTGADAGKGKGDEEAAAVVMVMEAKAVEAALAPGAVSVADLFS